MFDVGFGELLLIAVVALVVLGPERLPKAARFAGLWVRRARAQWYSVKAELERELEAEDLKRGLDEARTTFAQAQTRIQDEIGQAQTALRAEANDIGQSLDGIGHQAATTTATAPAAEIETADPTPAPEGNDGPPRP